MTRSHPSGDGTLFEREDTESFQALGATTLDLTHDPGIDAIAVLDAELLADRARLEADAVMVAEVGAPVGLQLHDGGHDHGAGEGPVEVIPIEPLDDVAHADGLTTRQACHQVQDPQLRERIAGLGYDGG